MRAVRPLACTASDADTYLLDLMRARATALLDNVRVEEHGERHPLQSYATVTVSGTDALSVNIFDISVRLSFPAA